jgi:ABC-2 type transport system ATP-binding protein
VLDAQNLTKRYQTKTAVNGVSFSIHPGEVLGYLGPNGSGKSTTIMMVVGLLEPTSGSLRLFGDSLTDKPESYKRRIGYVPEEPHLYTHLTAQEYLTLVGRLRGVAEATLGPRVNRLLQLFDLWDSRHQAMAGFSKGMRQRVLLSAAILHDPDLLVLDEPFSGLDINAAALFRALLGLFVGQGRMVLFSSHRFDVVEKLCSRVIMLREGTVVAAGAVGALRASSPAGSLEDVFTRVTQQEDPTQVAAAILDAVRT